MYRKSISLLLFSLTFAIVIAGSSNPVANSAAVVRSGKARFTVLTDMLIRMEYSPDSLFTDNASLTFVNRHLPVVPFKVLQQNGWLIINTGYLSLRYKENSGSFNAGNLEINYTDVVDSLQIARAGGSVKNDLHPGLSKSGFTWKPGSRDKQNLRGTTRTLDGALGKFSFGQMKKLPIEDGILSRSGWALIDDSERPLFDNSDWPWVQERKSPGGQDWYFFGYGQHYKQALYDFVSTSGSISLPPKYAFGIWYSRFWKYTEQDMKDIVSAYEKNDIPLDVLVVDMDWHLTERSSPEVFSRLNPKPNGWTGFTWEKKYFPDYKEFLRWTDDKRLQTCLNIHPAAGVQPHEIAFRAFAKAMGMDTSWHKTIPFDITNKKFAQAYFDVLLHPYEKEGVDFWWLDWQQWGGTNIKGVNPTFYLNYVHFSDMQRQGKRPLIFHRYGGLGNQRYEIGFSGDCIINWKSLSYQPEFTFTSANVGFGYWSHDIGGHTNPISKSAKQDPELFTRWVEWGAFSPIFRTHATDDPEIERRIWKYPEADFKAMRKAMQLRYSLLPYIYTYARFAYDSGISLVHPMYYEYPEAPEAYNFTHQYFFGNNMLVAPVHETMKGKENLKQKIWLPKGMWYDYRNNNVVKGGGVITGQYTLDEIPIFVKAGSIIPSQPSKTRIAGSVTDTIILTVYPAYDLVATFNDTALVHSNERAAFRLYEDDGISEAYRQNACSYTNFNFSGNSIAKKFTIKPDGRSYDGQINERCYEMRIVNCAKPGGVSVNGKKMKEGEHWSLDEQKHLLTIRTTREKIATIDIDIY